MKRSSALAILLAASYILFLAHGCLSHLWTERKTIIITGSTTVYPLAVKWAETYMRKNSGWRIIVTSGGSGKGVSDTIQGLCHIGMSSRDLREEELRANITPLTVAYDGIIIVINENNPAERELREKGINYTQLKKIYCGEISNWKEITSLNHEITVFTRGDQSGTSETFALFLGLKSQDELSGIGVNGNPGMIEALKRDAYGLGYVSVAFAYGPESNGIIPIPVDANENGEIDPWESVNTKQAVLSNIDRYPLKRKLYFIVKNPGEETIEFIKWCLLEGQEYVEETGFVPLKMEESMNEIKMLT